MLTTSVHSLKDQTAHLTDYDVTNIYVPTPDSPNLHMKIRSAHDGKTRLDLGHADIAPWISA
ncbi:hypothetical protein PABG_11695 [Paracoccidioides brasiliensis Pb03]|uniref:Uncharacterized protein n=2 Tax=Paracoccidioides brasiliensis TaxID=121759 RepID=A0A0A0HTD6_PARBD|nr:uncharacterized protein PADG_11300 [Paracoccidioides brasiliensis Pb18]KGM92479.1 hypothetical protein PADG_11300 [Paracoccidioides brasiliensis Pb18]KGY15390.1 hypothetical protein PABG_11695 [Paracoccidioides brasiliensis Pb03]ODH38524.1 hypothetical protein ACO22_02287 [Paracoccidioides brasiliensis]ODH48891.1 hypothetical protein GX48_04939 [Paracoccidioides brasiliensis]